MQFDVISMTFAYQTNLNISRMKQGNEIVQKIFIYFVILSVLSNAIIKNWGKISLHRHFNHLVA